MMQVCINHAVMEHGCVAGSRHMSAIILHGVDRMLRVAIVNQGLRGGDGGDVAGCECFVERDVNVFVDGGSDKKTGVMFVVRWQIRAASAETDTQR